MIQRTLTQAGFRGHNVANNRASNVAVFADIRTARYVIAPLRDSGTLATV
jgi:hypothetical protein